MSVPSPNRENPSKELAVPQPPAAPDAAPDVERAAPPRDLAWLRDRLLRIKWTLRRAAGAGIVAAALFLLPFAGWPWLPVVVGLGALVVLRLLRLDGLMRGWAPHVAGMVVVLLLLARTSPWVWALAVSLGIVVAGLLRLPRWQVLAVGAALLLVSGVGYGFALQQANAAAVQQQIRRGNENRDQLGERTVTRVLPSMLSYIGRNAPSAVCALLDDRAEAQFSEVVRAPDCAGAVSQIAERVTDKNRYGEPNPAPIVQTGDTWLMDGCHITWKSPGPAPGPQLGRLQVKQNSDQKFVVTAFSACG